MRVAGPDPHRLMPLACAVVAEMMRSYAARANERDDMLSDALLAAAVNLPRWRPDGGVELQSFLYQRMRWGIIDGIRARAPIGRDSYQRGVREKDRPVWQRAPLSLEAMVEWSEVDRPDSLFPDREAEHAFDAAEASAAVAELLPTLKGRQREVITRIYLDGQTGVEVAADWGVTESRVCQIRGDAMKRLRKTLQRQECA